MKKQIFALGLMLAATFTLTNCAKEIEGSVQEPESVGYPFEIVASTVDTKTANDGMSTKWVEGDQINIFHAVAGTTEYKNDTPYSEGQGHPFVISDVENGLFNGNICEELNSENGYDWYAFYPYNSYIETPANKNKGYSVVGSKNNTNQIQSGYNSMTHIAGENYPLAGKAIAVPAGDTPEITMCHVSSLIAINVTNDTEEDLIVTDVAFTAPVDIVGTYYIDFAGDITPDSFMGSGDSYVCKTAKLTVNNGTALPKGESAKFYLAVRPFTAANESELKIVVNDCEKGLKMTKDVTFTAGKIKTLNFAYDKEEIVVPEPDGADKVVIDFSTKGYANSAPVSKVTQMPVTVSFAKGSSSTAPAYYTTGTAVRAYAKNTITVSSALGKIVRVEFVFSTGDDGNEISANVGEFALPTWTGSEESVTFTISGEKGHRRIQKLEVYVDTEGETWDAIKLASPVVQCSAQTESALTFQWTAIENALGYEVIFDGKVEKVSETMYNVMELDPETEYEISVKALGDGTYYLDSEATVASGETTAKVESSGVPTEATLSFANKTQRTTYNSLQQVWQQNGITLTNDKSSSTTNVADYAAPARFYANSKITITAPGPISKIVFDANSPSYATAMKNSIGTVSGATVTVSSDKVTVTFTTAVESFVVAKLTAQVRMDSITVTYLK